ncbi:MAG TPA: hypothetical protein VLM79_34380 [Kofleriaceae bacterium]|nr:hypothetical protein [Kofleriaceae bacterium]
MSIIRTLTVMAALTAAPLAWADTPKAAPAEKKADKPADKPAAKADDKAGKKEPLSQATADRFMAFFDKLVEIVVANKDDCTKMASAVNAHVDANQALLKEIADAKASNKEPPAAMKDHVMQKTKDELQPAMTAKCSQDKSVMAAFNRIRPGAKTK